MKNAQETIQQIITKDAPPLAVVGGTVALSLEEAATIAQQVGVILGAVLTACILGERLWKWWKASRSD